MRVAMSAEGEQLGPLITVQRAGLCVDCLASCIQPANGHAVYILV